MRVLYSALLLEVFVAAAVEENISFTGMAVHVAVHYNAALPVSEPDQLLRVEDGRVQEFVRLKPLAVQVTTQQRAAVIAVNYTVRVQHRHDFENKVLPQVNRQFR